MITIGLRLADAQIPFTNDTVHDKANDQLEVVLLIYLEKKIFSQNHQRNCFFLNSFLKPQPVQSSMTFT